MAIVKWDPLKDLMIIRERMNRLFEESLNRTDIASGEYATGQWLPPMDIFETAKEIHIQMEIPGVDRETLNISVTNDVLTVRGERKFKNNVKEENFLRIERQYGHFERSFKLPHNVDGEKATAKFDDGVLKITVPKVETVVEKKINVDVT